MAQNVIYPGECSMCTWEKGEIHCFGSRDAYPLNTHTPLTHIRAIVQTLQFMDSHCNSQTHPPWCTRAPQIFVCTGTVSVCLSVLFLSLCEALLTYWWAALAGPVNGQKLLRFPLPSVGRALHTPTSQRTRSCSWDSPKLEGVGPWSHPSTGCIVGSQAQTWVWVPALLLTSCVVLGKSGRFCACSWNGEGQQLLCGIWCRTKGRTDVEGQARWGVPCKQRAEVISIFSSVQSCPTLCNSMDCGRAGLPGDGSCPSPTPRVYSNSWPLSWWCYLTISSSVTPFFSFNLSQHQGLFQWVSSSHQVVQVLELQLQHQSFQWIFRTDFL